MAGTPEVPSEVLGLQADMVKKLKGLFSKKQWETILDQTELRGLIQNNQKDTVTNMEVLFRILKSNRVIEIGKYGPICKILKQEDVEAEKIIDRYTKLIQQANEQRGKGKGTQDALTEDNRDGTKQGEQQDSASVDEGKRMERKRRAGAGALRKSVDNTHDARVVHAWKKAMDAVGFIKGPCFSGTGFRVGKDKILTAYHVAKSIIRKDIQDKDPDWSVLGTNDVCIMFNYLEGMNDPHPTFYFEDKCWGDEELDFAVLQLRVGDKTTTTADYPEAIKRFKPASPKNTFALLGHPGGKQMLLDPKIEILDPQSKEMKERLKNMKDYWRGKQFGENWGYPDIHEKHNVLFDCWVQHGASGSPGIEMDSNGEPVCSLMLTHGYPDFVFDKERYQIVPEDHPNMIEQAVTMEAIAKKLSKMGKDWKAVKEEIFANSTF